MFDGRRVKAVCSFSFSRLSRHVLVTALPGFLDANDELEWNQSHATLGWNRWHFLQWFPHDQGGKSETYPC